MIRVITEDKQASALNSFFDQFQRYFLVALKEGNIVGYLMFVAWEMGPNDRRHKPIQIKGKTLTEAKIIAFGVKKINAGKASVEHYKKKP